MSAVLRLPRPSRPSLPPATTSINGGGGHHPSWIQANSSKTQQNADTANWPNWPPPTRQLTLYVNVYILMKWLVKRKEEHNGKNYCTRV
jgi:hypothetical protein